MTGSVTGLALEPLSAWLAETVEDFVPPAAATLIAGGRSNLTYGISDARGAQIILRRPPLGTLQPTAQDVSREWTLLVGLESTTVPTAKPIAHCPDASVIGAPFFVMEFVGGDTVADPAAAGRLPGSVRAALAEELTTVLSTLHAQSPADLGLASLVRPGSYLERQLRRWTRQIEGYQSLASDLIGPVGDRLRAQMPAPQRTCLIHGDFKLANMRVDDTGRILAVLDWELAAIGDPLADLGWLLASWAEPEDPGHWIVPPPTTRGGFPARTELIAAYGAKSGLDVSGVDYYVAFSLWRWSCINEGIRARFGAGAMGDQSLDLAAVEAQIRWQLARAWELLS